MFSLQKWKWKISIRKQLYNIIKHKHVRDADKVTENSIPYVKLETAECRMDYGLSHLFDSSGENNLTKDIPLAKINHLLQIDFLFYEIFSRSTKFTKTLTSTKHK